MDFTLFYDPEERETVKDVILPNLEDAIINHHPLQDFPGDIQDDDPVLFFASDEQVKDLLPKLSKGKRLISALPHPDARELCTGWGIDYKLEKAIEHLKNQPDPIEIDVLYNNERPVFNTLVIGHAFQLVTARKNGGKSIFSRLKTLFSRFSRLRPFGITVHYKEDKQLTTAVSGVVLVQHGKSTLLSRLMLQSSFVNDGMMHAILISPRSVTGLMLFAIRSWWDEKKLPPYAGHIKTNRMRLECDEAFEFAEDGNSLSSKSLAGVAIAVALVPPLAVAGIGLGWWNGEIFFGAGLLLLTNLGGMVLAGAITFLFLGFSPFRLAKQGLIIASISVVLLSIPLGLGFYRMVYEDNIIETVESYSFNETVELKDVKVSKFNPLTISVRIVSDHNLSTAEIDEIKSALEGKLGKDISLEVNATVKR